MCLQTLAVARSCLCWAVGLGAWRQFYPQEVSGTTEKMGQGPTSLKHNGKGAALGEGVTSRAVTLRQKGLSGGVAGSPGRDDPWGVALREGVTLGGD